MDPHVINFDSDPPFHHKPLDVDQKLSQKLCLANREHVPLAMSGRFIGEAPEAPVRSCTLHPELKVPAGLFWT